MPDRTDDDDAALLLARERGDAAAGASESVARYAPLEALLASLPAMPADEPPADEWRKRVVAAIGAEPARPEPVRARRRWPWPALGALAAAALLVIVLVRRGGEPAAPTLAVEVKRSARPHLTPDTSVGDTLIVRASAPRAAELRVYDETGAELARCAQQAAGCVVGRDGDRVLLDLSLPLRAPGRVRPILFGAVLGGASLGLDGDVAAANQQHITVTPHEPIVIR